MTNEPERWELRDGRLYVDGETRILLAGDYPYYRDNPANWARRLDSLRRVGLRVITCYIPWRHHLDNRPGHFMFAGAASGNRDVLTFLGLVMEAGLRAILKPGPFVHGEIQFGGLPDHVCPDRDATRAPWVPLCGEPLRLTSRTLPSPFCPKFQADAETWLRAVAKDVVAPLTAGRGPVLGIQIGNEGLMCDGALPLDQVDWSKPGRAAYAAFLEREGYGNLKPPLPDDPLAACHDHHALRRIEAWAAWSEASTRELLERWAAYFPVPAVLNTPAPAPAPGVARLHGGHVDTWLCRNQPERLRHAYYGYTSWVGNVVTDDAALRDYVVTARRSQGPQLEENWGLSWKAPECALPIVPAYHVALGLLAGATGFTAYPACATDSWGARIAVDPAELRKHGQDPSPYEAPYGDAAPVGPGGRAGPAYDTLRLLNAFLWEHGGPLAATPLVPRVLLGVHLLGLLTPSRRGQQRGIGVAALVESCLFANAAFGYIDLDRQEPEPGGPPVLVPGSEVMARDLQRRLAAAAAGGATVVVVGPVPIRDEWLERCDVLAQALDSWPTAHRLPMPSGRPLREALAPWIGDQGDEAAALVTQRTQGDRALLVVLNRRDRPQTVELTEQGLGIQIALVARGFGMVSLRRGRVVGLLVKNVNELAGAAVAVRVTCGDDSIATTVPCDLMGTRRQDVWCWESIPPRVSVRV